MAQLTITEALAEIKTIGKRVETKRAFVQSYLYRQEIVRDALTNQGGSAAAIAAEMQAIRDLEERAVNIRLAINAANVATQVTVGDQTRSIAGWLTWRRDVAPKVRTFQGNLRSQIQGIRQQAQQKGMQIVQQVGTGAEDKNIVVNIDEKKLNDDIEGIETILGTLDGILSLKNATVLIDL